MRKTAAFVLFALVAAAAGSAQQPDANASQPGTTPGNSGQTTMAPGAAQGSSNSGLEQRSTINGGDVPANTEMRATLDTPLSSKTSKPGDRFTATISQSVQGRNGVVVPAGARVEGEVSESEQGKDIPVLHGKGVLNLRLRDVVLPNGQTVPLVASLVSVNHTNGQVTQKADNEGQIEPGVEGRSVAKDAGVGAGTGMIAGPVFGPPLRGLAIGALAGGGYILATNGKEVVNLPAQTGMVIRLEQPMVIQ